MSHLFIYLLVLVLWETSQALWRTCFNFFHNQRCLTHKMHNHAIESYYSISELSHRAVSYIPVQLLKKAINERANKIISRTSFSASQSLCSFVLNLLQSSCRLMLKEGTLLPRLSLGCFFTAFSPLDVTWCGWSMSQCRTWIWQTTNKPKKKFLYLPTIPTHFNFLSAMFVMAG